MKKIVILVVIIAVGLIGVATWLMSKPAEPNGSELGMKYADFAQCLTKKKVVMYGADSCPHCQRQKAMFGPDAFKHVTYVECHDNPKACIAKDIKGYPTWIFPDGDRFEGEQSFEKLSKESSCALPKS